MTMIAVFKPDEITSASFDDVVKIARAGLGSLIGSPPADKVTALVIAKITLESGRQGMMLLTSCHCGNVGNIKAGPDYEGMYTLFPCNEVINGKVTWFGPEGQLSGKGGVVVGQHYDLPPAGEGHPQCRFRAYANEVDGLYEYLDFIWQEKYRDAREALLTGDPAAYVHALKVHGYFTADEATYEKAVAGLFAEFMARLSQRPAPVMPVPDVSHLILAQPYNVTTVTRSLKAELHDFSGDDEPTVVTKG